MRSRFARLIFASAVLLACFGSSSGLALAAESPGRPPNFVLIFTDDQGYQDLGCFGSPNIKTPNIDRMAAEGMRLTSFYVAAPVCSPSRAALMTGCYPVRVGIPGVLSPSARTGLDPSERTIAEILRDRGYATACVGKWHLGHLAPHLPINHGFDRYFGLPYSNDMGPKPNKNNPPLPLIRGLETIERDPDQRLLTERYTEEAIRFIRDSKDKPFFLYLPHTMPHVPLFVSERFAGKSEGGLYGDVIECIDWSVGQILDTLKELGLDENTLVFYTSDNGPWLVKKDLGGSALPLRAGKGTTYEGGMRVPAVARWPGRIPAGSACEEMALSMDLAPTFARLAGAAMPEARIIDGKDIWPLLAGEPGAKTPHEAFFYYKSWGLEAVRSGDWKLRFKKTPAKKGDVGEPMPPAVVPGELYNLAEDIGEEHNRIEEHPEIVERLSALAERCREDIGDAQTGAKGANRRPPASAPVPDAAQK